MARSPSLSLSLALLASVSALACASGTASPVAPPPQSVELPPAPPRASQPATAATADPPPPPSAFAASSAAEELADRPSELPPAPPTELAGRLAPSVVLATVKPSAGRIRRCYELALAANPALTGKITVRFVIGRDGATRSASAGPPDFPDPLLLRCVEKVISTLRFPAPEGGDVHVTYPFSFVPDTQVPGAPSGVAPPAPAPAPKPKKP
jgi:hypothetical protein